MPRGKKEDGTLRDGRKPPIFIHSDIDDMTDLPPNAMRVYMHLARRADKSGTAWPSYQSIGDHCFGSVYKHRDTRRKVAIESITALINAHLIRKELRQDDQGQQSNCYVLLDPPVTVQSQGSDHTVTDPCDSTIIPPCDRGVTPPVTVQSPEDHPCEGTPIEGTPIEGHPSSRAEQKLTEKPDDDDLKTVYKAWEDAMEPKPSAYTKRRLGEFAAEYGAKKVIRMILDCADAGGRSLKYLETALKNDAAGIEPPARANGNGSPYTHPPATRKKDYTPDEYADIILGVVTPEQLAAFEAENTNDTPTQGTLLT